MSDFPKVKIVRMKKRVGLIKARIAGTNAATGETLTFLDSHVECAEGWLVPLLDRIARDKTKVVCPVIDVIDDSSLAFSYQDASGLQVGGFNWEMTVRIFEINYFFCCCCCPLLLFDNFFKIILVKFLLLV